MSYQKDVVSCTSTIKGGGGFLILINLVKLGIQLYFIRDKATYPGNKETEMFQSLTQIFRFSKYLTSVANLP